MICKKCGNELSDDAAFCNKCGTKKEEHPIEYCVNCGGALSEADEFCSNCGTPVRQDIQKEIFCWNCGNSIVSSQKFCPKCGAKQAGTARRHGGGFGGGFDGGIYTSGLKRSVSSVTEYLLQKSVFFFASLISAITCIILLFLKWIEVPALGYFGYGSSVSVFKIYGWASDIYDSFNMDKDALFFLLVLLILICIACIIVYAVNAWHIATQSQKVRGSGNAATVLMTVLFLFILIGIAVINNFIKEESYGYVNSVASIAPVAYIATVLAYIHRFAFLPRLNNGSDNDQDIVENELSNLPQKTCPNCKRDYDIDYPKCPFCGEDNELIHNIEKENVRCAACGVSVQHDAAFCRQCGADLR